MRLNLSLMVVLALFWHSCMSSDPSPNSCSVAECINSGNTNASSAIICNSCTLKLISNSDKAERFFQFQQELINEDAILRNRLTALNADVLMLIFDELHMLDIVKLLSVYPSQILLAVARDCFRIRYKDYTIVIDEKARENGINFDSKRKLISVYSQIENMIRFFGAEFRGLSVGSLSTHITQLINKCKTSSLKKLYISVSESELFTKPFVGVEELWLTNDIKRLSMPFNQLFPSIRRLSIRIYYGNFDFSFLLCKLPNLEYFDFDEMKNETIISEFFRNNPQIKNLRTREYLNQTLCDSINNYLTMEDLTTSSLGYQIDHHTTFVHVKRFTMEVAHHGNIGNSFQLLNLPNVEYFQFALSGDIPPGTWKAFCRKHNNLKHVELLRVFSPDSAQLVYLVKGLRLHELTLNHMGSHELTIGFNIIDQIIEGSGKIVKLNLLGFYLRRSQVKSLRNKFESHWNIIERARSDDGQRWDLILENKN